MDPDLLLMVVDLAIQRGDIDQLIGFYKSTLITRNHINLSLDSIAKQLMTVLESDERYVGVSLNEMFNYPQFDTFESIILLYDLVQMKMVKNEEDLYNYVFVTRSLKLVKIALRKSLVKSSKIKHLLTKFSGDFERFPEVNKYLIYISKVREDGIGIILLAAYLGEPFLLEQVSSCDSLQRFYDIAETEGFVEVLGMISELQGVKG